jgi:hypothetical protein
LDEVKNPAKKGRAITEMDGWNIVITTREVEESEKIKKIEVINFIF